MKTIKPQKLGVLVKTIENGDACHFVVSVLVFFSFDPEAGPLAEVDMWKLAATELGEEPLDLAMPKERAEVLVTGSAYPLGGARIACAPRIAIGSVDKTLQVAGDRFWNGSAPTAPTPFTEMPIDYAHAFGGSGYAANPLGKGIHPIQTEHGELLPLPNIDAPNHKMRTPADHPSLPAGFGPYDLTWPQRFSKMGTYDAAWMKEQFPGFAADMDWSVWNAAPADQRIEGYFRGDEPFVVEYMHPEEARLEGRLPGIRARVFATQKTDSGDCFREIPTRVDTVRLFPHAKRGIMIFRGVTAVAEDDAADVLHLVLGCEDLEEAKPIEHYRNVLARRLDRKTGYLFGLSDRDLMPAKVRAGSAPPDDVAEMSALVATEGLLRKHMRSRLEREHEQAKKEMLDKGLDPVSLPPLPPEEPPPDVDDLPDHVERLGAEAEKAKADGEKRKAEAERELRAMCQARGLDYDRMMREAQAELGGPPEPMWPRLAKMKEKARAASANAAVIPGLEALLTDPNLEERTRLADQRMLHAYRKFAHLFPAAAELHGDQAVRVRNDVVTGHGTRKSFAGCDLTGANLAGLDLTKADFRGAFLEAADFTGAELGGADFTDAVLARANLTRANLFAAKLTGANLGSAILRYAEIGGGVDLSGATLTKADLTGARFGDARMHRVDLSEVIVVGASFVGIQATEVKFIKTDLSGVKLEGADLTKCSFIECAMEGADFTGAKLVSAVFLAVNANGAVLAKADLTNLRVVMGSSFEGGNFSHALLEGANLRGTKLGRSDFTEARLTGADLSQCDLQAARLRRAIAPGAQLVRAQLAGADMRSLNLMEGSLQKATLSGADLRGANLFRVDLAKATFDGATNFRDANTKHARFVPKSRGNHAPR